MGRNERAWAWICRVPRYVTGAKTTPHFLIKGMQILPFLGPARGPQPPARFGRDQPADRWPAARRTGAGGSDPRQQRGRIRPPAAKPKWRRRVGCLFLLSLAGLILQAQPSCSGEVTEWSIVPDSKSGVPQGTVGSNPTLSASLGVYLPTALFWARATPRKNGPDSPRAGRAGRRGVRSRDRSRGGRSWPRRKVLSASS